MLLTVLAIAVFTIFFVAGVVGIIVPILPGVPLAGVGALLAGWMTGFVRLGLTPLLIVAGLVALSQATEYLAGVVGAKRYGASQSGMWGSIIGSLAGLIWFPPFGFLAGALVGAIVAELLIGRELEEAWRSGVGALLGSLGGVVVKFFIIVAIAIVVFPRLF